MSLGGIEAMITSIANEMANNGIDVSVCSIFVPKKESIFWGRLNTLINKFDLGKKNLGFSIKEIFKIYRIIKEGKYDIVYLHGFIQYYFLAIILLHRKIKFCYTMHTDAYMENVGWDRKFFKLKHYFFKKRWVIPITISQASQDSFAALYNCSSELIPNGVSRPNIIGIHNIIDDVRISTSTKVFFHPGRISKAKNQLVLVKVFDRLIKNGEDVVLVIAGSNDDVSIYNEIQPYFSDRIRYIGPRSDIPELFAKADAFCLPSIWEGLPVTLLEALSVGCIPICSPVGGIVNVVKPGSNGLLSASSNEEDYYATVRDFLSMSSDRISEMKRCCIESFAPYDISFTAKAYLNIFNK